MEQKEKMQDKIKKLLALSSNNPNPLEAEAAFLKAQKLMLEYKIEEHELLGDKKNIEVSRAFCSEPANTPWARSLAQIFAKNFGCMMYYTRLGSKSVYPVFFGEIEEVDTCKSLYDYAVVWLNKRACSYATKKRNDEGIVKGVKQDFILGFLKGLEDKYKEQVDADNRYALMVVVKEEVKDEYKKETAGFQKANFSGRVNTHGSAEARKEGYLAGRTFGTSQIGG